MHHSTATAIGSKFRERSGRGVALQAESDGDKKGKAPLGSSDPLQNSLLAFDDIPLPLTRPRLSYVLLAGNLSVYSAGVVIALTLGNEASNNFFLLLAKSNQEVGCSASTMSAPCKCCA
jgi:hypothetical protein